MVYIDFTKDVYLLGIYGDFSRPQWVHHANANGWYYVVTTTSGKKYILARASCFNNMDNVETKWIQDGFATIRATKPRSEKEDDREDGKNDSFDGGKGKTPRKPKISVNGEEVAEVDGYGNINITVNGGDSKASVGNIDVRGGSSNNNLGGSSSSSTGGGKTTTWYDPNPSPAPNYQPAYQPGYQQQPRYDVYGGGSLYIDRAAQYYGSLQPPYRGSCNTGYGYSGGYSGGVVVPVPVPVPIPSGCYGASQSHYSQPQPHYSQPRPQTNTTVYPQSRGGFVPNGTGSYGRGNGSSGGFQSNGTGSYGRSGGSGSGGGQHSSGGFQQNGTGGR